MPRVVTATAMRPTDEPRRRRDSSLVSGLGTETRYKLLKYTSGSQWQVDPSTAAGLILVGAAVRLPSQVEAPPVPGIGGMSMLSESA